MPSPKAWLILFCAAGCGTASEPIEEHASVLSELTASTPIETSIRARATDGAVMVPVAAGAFLRGSRANEGEADERPQREIYVSSFWIDQTELTVARYRECIDAGVCPVPAMEERESGRIRASCNWGRDDRDRRPINCVRRDEAEAYCRWAGARLPTEAEWEKAARGADGRTHPWGASTPSCELAVWEDPREGKACGTRFSWDVGMKPSGASPCGALDMAGNVWEWTSDGYDAAYYAVSPDRDPRGPEHAVLGVVRGGGYGKDMPPPLRVSARLRLDPSIELAGVGFRCASDPFLQTP